MDKIELGEEKPVTPRLRQKLWESTFIVKCTKFVLKICGIYDHIYIDIKMYLMVQFRHNIYRIILSRKEVGPMVCVAI